MHPHIETRSLEGLANVIFILVAAFHTRPIHPELKPKPRVSADRRLWTALQAARGGSWGECGFDVDRIRHLLDLGARAEENRGT